MASALALVLAFGLLSPSAQAATEPAHPAAPTGCATNVFSLEIEASPAWGIVPFRSHLSVSLKSRTDSIEMVRWDFGSDGILEAAGREADFTFCEPLDNVVSVTVRTRERGVIRTQKIVSGHTGILSLTFDDGCKSVYSQAGPVLAARGVAGTAYIVPSWVRDYGAAYMSWNDIYELSAQGWDIGSHTMTHKSLAGVDDSTLHYELGQSRVELRAHGHDGVSFSLPHGEYDEPALDAVRIYYESCRAVGGALNPPVEFADPYLLLSKTGQHWIPFSTYRADIDSVASYGGWYILNNHRVWSECYDTGWCIRTQMLKDIIDYALSRRLRVASVRNALEYRKTLEVNAGVPLRPGVPGDEQGNGAGEDAKGDPGDGQGDGNGDGRGSGDGASDGNGPGSGTWDDPGGKTGIEWAFPNPFMLPGTIEFRLPAPATATAQIYDCAGRLVRDLECSGPEATDHRVRWDGLNAEGERVASGSYYCVVTSGGEIHSSGPILILK